MEFRSAGEGDLTGLRALYGRIVAAMTESGLEVWDEAYPAGILAEDIEKKRLYLTENDRGEPAAAFALCPESAGERFVNWERDGERAVWLERLGVDPAAARCGLGGWTVEKAAALARAQGAETLRLFAAEQNLPAIRFYEKCGFRRAEGVYGEDIGGGCVLREFGFEKRL